MSGHEPAWRGGCLCGVVTFEAEGTPLWVGLCHCRSCRRATGGALVAAAAFPREKVHLAGATLAQFASSLGVQRSFCSACGTSLAYRNECWPADIHLMAGAFERPEALEPRFHIFAETRLPWLRTADDLPRYRTTPSVGALLDER